MMTVSETLGKRAKPGFDTCVCVVEHNLLAARHLRRVLKGNLGVRLASLEDVSSLHTVSHVHVFVVDRGTLIGSLNQCLQLLRARFPDSKILVTDHKLTQEDTYQLLADGVHGVLRYSDVDVHLGTAIRTVRGGHLWVPKDTLEHYVMSMADTRRVAHGGLSTLTPREIEVARLR